MLKTRRTWILWFVLLAIPGSGFLKFDGLPFSSKTEFVAITVFVLALFNRKLRSQVSKFLNKESGQTLRWVNTALVCVILIKFFTFVLAPLGDGFEACYRSIYQPPADSVLCEKSYEAPFINNDNVNGLNQITRMENEINFGPTGNWVNGGASHTTWKLPFVNDYPRFSELWLDRIPFTAKFGSFIETKRDSFIPVQLVGQASVTVANENFSLSSYTQQAILLVPVKPGRHGFNLDYKFADSDTAEIPGEQPPIKGPWAQLFVGKPTSMKAALADLTLNLRGWSVDTKTKSAPKRYEVRDLSDKVIASAPSVVREDVAAFYGNKQQENSGFDLKISKVGLKESAEKLVLVAIYSSGNEISIATLGHAINNPADLSTVQINMPTNSAYTAVFDAAWFSINTTTTPTLNPLPQIKPNFIFSLLLQIFDLLILFSALVAMLYALFTSRQQLRTSLPLALGFVVFTFAINRFDFDWWGYKSAIVPFGISITFAVKFWRSKTIDLFSALIGATVAIASPMIQLIRRFGGLEDANWWGFQIFRGRDSDWFAYQGYAKTVFNEASLRGGEAVFFFQPANRYFIFLQHLIFGENDVLISILVGVVAIVAGIFVARETFKYSVQKYSYLYFFGFSCAIFLILSEQIIQIFASAPASELIAGVLLMICFGLLSARSLSVGAAYLCTTLAALTSQFRAEQIFGAILIFVLLQILLKSKIENVGALLRVRLCLVFGLIVCLSLLHNLYYGDSFTFFTNTRNYEGNNDVRIRDLLNFFSDADVREIIFFKLRMIFGWKWPMKPLDISFSMFHLLWLAAIISAVRSKLKDSAIWLAAAFPFVYLLPLLLFKIETYYPRRIIATQLAFGLSAIYVLSKQNSARSAENLEGNVGHIRADAIDSPTN